MTVPNVPWMTVLVFYKKKTFPIFGQLRGLFKQTDGRNWGFCVWEKGERENTNG